MSRRNLGEGSRGEKMRLERIESLKRELRLCRQAGEMVGGSCGTTECPKAWPLDFPFSWSLT